MHSSGRVLAAAALLAATFGASLATQDAPTLYRSLLSREGELRRELERAPQRRTQPPGEASAGLLRRVRAATAAYEKFSQSFARSEYGDDALWQAAVLSSDAFWQFGDGLDRAAALRFFEQLRSRFPASPFATRIDDHVDRLNGADRPSPAATLTAVRRDLLPGAVRFTIELEREAMFQDARLDGPPRVLLDLRYTQAVEALREATLQFPDDVVRQARIGRQPDDSTRIVFDLQGTPRYSVYSLYNPYRIVVDFERTATADGEARSAQQAPATPRQPDVPPATAAANTGGAFSLSRQLGLGVSRIVVDPGHGGHDPGAQVRGLSEAEVVLDIALRLERLLEREPGVDVVLTRRTNAYVPLEERTAIANRSEADLFLSIHVNASANESARGFETYFLDFAPSPEAEALAARENAGSSRTMGSLPEIVKAIALNNKIDESRDFATTLQRALHERLRTIDPDARSLGVKQAPFMVLIGATMPSALAEVSFLTNRQEAALLRTTAYRQEIAEALYAGIADYQQALKQVTALRSGR